MANLCIIPARGGSKRIPKKNIKSFLGKPIIAYSIEAAINSTLFDEIMVSTDDDEIAEAALKYGANVPFRRTALTSNDHATTFDVLEEVVKEYQNRNQMFDNICCLYATAPFVMGAKLKHAYDLMMEQKNDSIFPMVEFSFPIQRALKIDNGKLSFVNPAEKNTRSQDLEKRYHDAGQFYFMKTDIVLGKGELVSDKAGTFVINEMEAQDIDSETDWLLAELKYRLLSK